MTPTSPDFLLQLAMILATGGAVYGGIRAELKNLRHDTDANARATAKAHARIDEILLK